MAVSVLLALAFPVAVQAEVSQDPPAGIPRFTWIISGHGDPDNGGELTRYERIGTPVTSNDPGCRSNAAFWVSAAIAFGAAGDAVTGSAGCFGLSSGGPPVSVEAHCTATRTTAPVDECMAGGQQLIGRDFCFYNSPSNPDAYWEVNCVFY